MGNKNSSSLNEDIVVREQAALDKIISATGRDGKVPKEARVGVQEARRSASVVAPTTGRTATRILFISTDVSLLNQTKTSLDGYAALADVFDEVHIVILRAGIKARTPVLRVADNVWVYVATSKHLWSTVWSGWQLIQDQFEFADGFRPDLIVARDPLQSAALAYIVGAHYKRPTQLHIVGQFAKLISEIKNQRWYKRWLLDFIVGKFLSVRTPSEEIATQIKNRWPEVLDVAVLPQYRPVKNLVNLPRTQYLQQKFPQFSFIILYIGALSHNSTAFRALDAVRSALSNPRVGMVMVGDGPARNEFIKRAKLLGIYEHVVFERTADDINQYLLSADTMLITDTDAAGDDWSLYGAAAGVPMIMSRTAFRRDLFETSEAALVCDEMDVVGMTKAVSQILNDAATRIRLRELERTVVATRLHDDPESYRVAYRLSVEEAIVVEATKEELKKKLPV